MECSNCHKPNPGGLVYCKECGKSLFISSDNPAGIEWIKILVGGSSFAAMKFMVVIQ